MYCTTGVISSQSEGNSHGECEQKCNDQAGCESYLWRQSGTCHLRSIRTSKKCFAHNAGYTLYIRTPSCIQISGIPQVDGIYRPHSEVSSSGERTWIGDNGFYLFWMSGNGGQYIVSADLDEQTAGALFLSRDKTLPSVQGLINLPGFGWRHTAGTRMEMVTCTDKLLVSIGRNAGGNGNLGLCEGDCDSDDHCAAGLKCFQRSGFTRVPGCSGAGEKDAGYCYDPTGSIELSGSNLDNASNLGQCTMECDEGQCGQGLKCFQRDDGETIPGCVGAGRGKNWDYCYDPSWNSPYAPGVTIVSCLSSRNQESFHCRQAYDGITTGTTNGWAYSMVVPAWADFYFKETSDVYALSILSGVDRNDHQIKDFAIQCLVGSTWLAVTNVKLTSGQAATITGNRVRMTAGHQDVVVSFDTVQNCNGVKLRVYDTNASNDNLVLTELTVHGYPVSSRI